MVKATERALFCSSPCLWGTQIVRCWSDHIKSPGGHLRWPREDSGHAFRHKVLSSRLANALARRCASLFSEAASISVTQHAEVTLGATCSLLRVLLAGVHVRQFISVCQFVRATHFCLLAEYFKSESLLLLVCSTRTCEWVSVSVRLRFITRVEGWKFTNLCVSVGATPHPPARRLSLCSSVILSVSAWTFSSGPSGSPQQTMCVRTCRLPNLLLQSYGWGTAEDILYQTD